MPAAKAEVAHISDADYRRMVETVSDYAIYFLDPGGFVMSWNEGARKLKGYEAAEVIGRHFSMFYPQDLVDRQWPDRELETARATGHFEDEGWRVRKDGKRFWANSIITAVADSSGELRGYTKITRDLTAKRRSDELLRLSEERFRLLVEGVKDYAIFMLDPSGHIVSWNEGAQRIKGYTASEVIGEHFSIFYPEDVAASGWPEEELRRAIKDGRFEDEGWRVRKDGSRFWASVVITAIYDRSGRHRGFGKVTRDMTEKKKIRALEDEGRRMTTFLAMLGHELRNPLAPITNALAIMAMDDRASSSTRNARGVIERQVRHMTRLVDDLLDVSRITSGKIQVVRKPVRLEEAVMEAIESVDPLLQQKSHELSLNMGDEDIWVSGDRARLVQVVANLLSNAAKFTPDHGEIDVTVQRVGPQVEIRVRDNGRGIPPHLLPTIFNLFTQGEQDLSRSEGGLGLGLSLVRQLVSLHDGDVTAYSTGEPGKGAEFVVQLPTIAAPSRSDPDRETTPDARRRILVVDDNRDAADTMAMLLQSMGYSSQVVYDGPAALAAVKRQPPAAVFLDIGLPGLSGLDVAERISAEVADPPHLIAVTGYGQDKDREASLRAGFYAHLAKPVHVNDLTVLLRKLFG